MKSKAPSRIISSIKAVKPERSPARILVVDANKARAADLRRLLEKEGFGEPLLAHTGDEALDVLGAHAQRFDLVLAWGPLADDAKLDFFGILRRLASPVRLVCVTPLAREKYPKPGRLAGVTCVIQQNDLTGLPAQIDILLRHGSSVAQIVTSKHVPRLLADTWAMAIYGAKPGSTFTGPLD
jgi:CheY-like chemotaxis protein